jgi:hypothetical protein
MGWRAGVGEIRLEPAKSGQFAWFRPHQPLEVPTFPSRPPERGGRGGQPRRVRLSICFALIDFAKHIGQQWLQGVGVARELCKMRPKPG